MAGNPYLKSQAKSIKVNADPYESGNLEREVHKEILKKLKENGYIARTIYTGGIPIGGGKLVPNPAEGIADIFVCRPWDPKNFFWVEVKANKGGWLSPAQQTFQWDVTTAGMKYYVVTSWQMLKEKAGIEEKTDV